MMRIVTILAVFLVFSLNAQVSITSGNLISIDFNSYAGSGFDSAPAAGQLDSDEWTAEGMSDGDVGIGASANTGDFARGTSTGGVTTGGFYAFEVSTGDFAFGVQPGTNDWTPGNVTLRLQNNTGGTLTKINIQYDVYVFNDQARANSFNFEYSEDNESYFPVGSLDFISTEAADPIPAWVSNLRTTSLTGLNVADAGFLYLRWTGNDVSGAGSRDEFALDNILISDGDTPLPIELTSFVAVGSDNQVALRWSTASEIDNQGFVIMRADAKVGDYQEIDSYKDNNALKGAGTSSNSNDYTFIDKQVFNNNTYWYKLVDVDLNGIRTEHGPIHATPHSAVINVKEGIVPGKFALYQNTPNPFNPTTKITFDVPALREGAMQVAVNVYNLLGQRVASIFNGVIDAGRYETEWNGLTEEGTPAPTGIYIYQIVSESFSQSKRMVLVK